MKKTKTIHSKGEKALRDAAVVIRDGGIVAVPTDTVYGLACDPFNQDAVSMLFEVKSRQAKPIPVLCSGSLIAESLVELNEKALSLARLHWPGALTIVAPMKEESRFPPLLHQGTRSLGVRVPSSDFCLQLARKVGGSITGTSANLSGQPSSRTAAEVIDSLEGKIDLVIDGGKLLDRESTVVKVSGENVEVLREGSVRIREGRSRR